MITILRENNKILLMGLAAALLLTGCGDAQPTETTVPSTTVVEETTVPPDTLYVPDSPVERATDGAVQVYEADGNVTGAAVLGDSLVIALDDSRLQLLGGEWLEVRKERDLETSLSWADPSLVLTDQGMAYYDKTGGNYVVLDSYLVSAAKASIGDTLLCEPVISRDLSTIYYAADGCIKAMDFTSGITRTLREEYGTVLSLEGLLFEDSLLHYVRQLEDGTVQNCFIATADGSSRYTGKFQGQICAWTDTVSGILELTHPMGTDSWILRGGTSIDILTVSGGWDGILFPDADTVVIQKLDQVGLTLSRYQLSTGALTARVTLPQYTTVFTAACTQGDMIWLCGTGSRFLCWDTAASEASGEALETAGSLADSSLEELENRAEVLSDQYGVDIAFVEEENRTDGVDYSGYPEYRIAMYAGTLDTMEEILREVPSEFWYQLARKTDSGRLRIRLVDDFDPAMEMGEATGSFSVMNDELTIQISIGTDMKAIFYHQLWHVMEVRISSTTSKLSSWSKLNPSGFSYDDALEPGGSIDSAYLDTGSNYFADAYGMNSGREDRAQVFMYACMDGQDAVFQSDAIQKKLAKLCDVIRSVYKLSDDAVLPWEQYLA